MSDVLLDEQNLYDIADAIREKLGVQTEYLPSEMPEAIMSIIGGGGGDVTLLTRAEWDLLSPAAKRSLALTAIEDYITGFNRGELVNGADYVEPPIIVNAYSMNGGNAGSLSHTFAETGDYGIFICRVMGDTSSKPLSSLNITINGETVDDVEYEYPSSNNNIAINTFTFVASVEAGDVLNVENVTMFGNSGLQLFVLKNVVGFEFYDSRSNNNSSFDIVANGRYYLQAYQWGYYSGGNNFSINRCEIDNADKASTPTPNETQYWYGGTYVIMLTSGAQPSPTPSIYFGNTTPDSERGNDGDYYYRRVKDPAVGVPYWDNRQNSNTSISGYRFTTTEECVVVGVRVYNRGNARTVTAGIYESNGTAIEEVTAEASANGWTTLMFEHSHALQDATTYFSLANWGESGHAVYRSTYTIATDSRITSLVGAYDSTSNPSIDNSNVYGCDLLLENPNGDYYIITDQYVKEDDAWVRIA